jgi:hypothetical protein
LTLHYENQPPTKSQPGVPAARYLMVVGRSVVVELAEGREVETGIVGAVVVSEVATAGGDDDDETIDDAAAGELTRGELVEVLGTVVVTPAWPVVLNDGVGPVVGIRVDVAPTGSVDDKAVTGTGTVTVTMMVCGVGPVPGTCTTMICGGRVDAGTGGSVVAAWVVVLFSGTPVVAGGAVVDGSGFDRPRVLMIEAVIVAKPMITAAMIGPNLVRLHHDDALTSTDAFAAAVAASPELLGPRPESAPLPA